MTHPITNTIESYLEVWRRRDADAILAGTSIFETTP